MFIWSCYFSHDLSDHAIPSFKTFRWVSMVLIGSSPRVQRESCRAVKTHMHCSLPIDWITPPYPCTILNIQVLKANTNSLKNIPEFLFACHFKYFKLICSDITPTLIWMTSKLLLLLKICFNSKIWFATLLENSTLNPYMQNSLNQPVLGDILQNSNVSCFLTLWALHEAVLFTTFPLYHLANTYTFLKN